MTRQRADFQRRSKIAQSAWLGEFREIGVWGLWTTGNGCREWI